MSYEDILKLNQTFMAVGLAGENVKFVKKKKKTTNDFVGMGFKNVVGSSLIKSTGEFL